MSARSKASDSQLLLRSLAEFYYELRKFLHFSERAAVDAGLQPQQHQTAVTGRGRTRGVAVMIAVAAKRPSLRHHSVVELVNRSEREGFPMVRVSPVGVIAHQLWEDATRLLGE